jgi:hypothetical protein
MDHGFTPGVASRRLKANRFYPFGAISKESTLRLFHMRGAPNSQAISPPPDPGWGVYILFHKASPAVV